MKKATKKMAKATRLDQLEAGLQSVKDWHEGKAKLRTWELDASGNRRMYYQSYEEYRKEKDPGGRLRDIRKQLGMSQNQFAKVMRTSVRTLQGWEIGKGLPAPALVLAELLRDSQDVRRRLISGAA